MIRLDNVVKSYVGGPTQGAPVLRGVSLSIDPGTFCTILGPSGSGKTTLLKCMSGLERVDSGTVTVDGADIVGFSPSETARFRRDEIAFVFQEYNLIGDLTLAENITLDRSMAGDVRDLAEAWDIAHVLDHFPSQCSGGQQQKAALLRALNKRSKVLFCDEPTGALDTASTAAVLSQIQDLVRDFGLTTVMITHNELVTRISHHVVRLHDGLVEAQQRHESPRRATEVEW